MGVIAGCTALYTYMLGQVVNGTYFQENVSLVAILGVAAVTIFVVRGLAYYGQAVLLARIGNQISANVQKRMFDKLLRHNLGYFSDVHSSAHMAQVTYGCMGVASILNLLVTASGRDMLLLIGLVTVMVHEDPLLSVIGILLMPAAMLVLRNLTKRVRALANVQYARWHEHPSDAAGDAARDARGQGLPARGPDSAPSESRDRSSPNGCRSDGAHEQSLNSVDGDARRLCGSRRVHVRGLSYQQCRRDARRIRCFHHRLPPRL